MSRETMIVFAENSRKDVYNKSKDEDLADVDVEIFAISTRCHKELLKHLSKIYM